MSTDVIFREPEAQQEHRESRQEARVAYKSPEFPAQLKPEIVLVTPADAGRYLAAMHANRVPSKIDTSVMEMNLKEGTFFPGISVVYFDDGDPELEEDRPWDGQHRFQAVVNTRVPAYMIFVRGISEEESAYIDTGRRRMFSDSLRIEDVQGYSRQAPLARLMAIYEHHGIEGVRSPSRVALTQPQMRAYVDSPLAHEAIIAASGIHRHCGGNETLLAYSLLRTADRDDPTKEFPLGKPVQLDPDGFWEKVRTGEQMVHGDPALTLNKYLMRGKIRSRKPADMRLMQLYALASAWNKHVLNQEYRSVTPRFEVRASTGDTYFPGSSVPDFIPADTEEKAKRMLINARNSFQRERARANFMAPAALAKNNGK